MDDQTRFIYELIKDKIFDARDHLKAIDLVDRSDIRNVASIVNRCCAVRKCLGEAKRYLGQYKDMMSQRSITMVENEIAGIETLLWKETCNIMDKSRRSDNMIITRPLRKSFLVAPAVGG
jgi:hypothetical protein